MKKKVDKLRLYNNNGKAIISVTSDGDVVWHSAQNTVNKLEIIEAIHTTLENAADLKDMMRNKVENDIYNEILDICSKCVTIEEVTNELEGRIIFKKVKGNEEPKT